MERVGMLTELIRELGLSDSAAAVRLGLGASTVSRWKREVPEVRMLLAQAREDCRAVQLQQIMRSARAEGARGWRAAAWLLERLFPEDYATRAETRESYRLLRERREEREANEAELAEVEEQLRACEVQAVQVSAPVRETRLAEAAQIAMPASFLAEEEEMFAQAGDLHNCRNSEEEEERVLDSISFGLKGEVGEKKGGDEDEDDDDEEEEIADAPMLTVHDAFAHGSDLQNCRNSHLGAPGRGPCVKRS